MRELIRVVWSCSLTVGLLGGPVAAAQAPADASSPAFTSIALPQEFSGVWDYNALESINIVTGRPEQSPRSATQRSAPAVPQNGRASSSGGEGAPAPGRIAVIRGSGLGPTPEMMREARDMSRDLLEVPEALTINVHNQVVSFTDDIERVRTYPVDGSKQKYRLGASEFHARVEWNGTQLRKDIEGSFGFRMSEVYFLSPDARRLFVIIRIGSQGRNRLPTGVNRVYDRVTDESIDERASTR
jgi:hypothetical protein